MSKGSPRGTGKPIDGQALAAFAICGVLVIAIILNIIGITPARAVSWAKGLPSAVQDSRCWLGGCDAAPSGGQAVGGTRPVGAVGPFPVTKITDGDTIHVDENGKNVTIRDLGIDTPETHDPRKPVQCYGPEASAEGTKLLKGKQVYLEYDATQGGTDKYGRTLAYVWVGSQLYQLTMLRDGYAHEYTYGKAYKRQAQFRAAQAAAKAAGRGFWSASTCNGNTTQPEPSGR